MSEQYFYKWANIEQTRIKKVSKEAEPVLMAIKQTNKLYHIYGRYTSHDNYMGYLIPEHLLTFAKYLKTKAIRCSLCDNPKILEMGECYMAMNAYIILEKKNLTVYRT